MSSQKAGRGGLLHVGYPHQGTVNDGIAVRKGLFAVAATRDYFSAVSARPGHRGKIVPSRRDQKPGHASRFPAVPVQRTLRTKFL